MSVRPLLLLLDGHSTHYQPKVVRYANQVIMLCLPPHTTHETQPLDCGVFAPLKSHCHDFIQKNPGKVITKFFNRLFSQAWLLAVTPSNILAGFKTCGVYPFNPSALNMSVEDDETHEDERESPIQPETAVTSNEEDSSLHFTDEQQELFKRRFEEGYDLEDADYSCWLK